MNGLLAPKTGCLSQNSFVLDDFWTKLVILLLPLTVLNLSLGSVGLPLFTFHCVCVILYCTPQSIRAGAGLVAGGRLGVVGFPPRNQLAVLRRSLAPQPPYSVIAVLLCLPQFLRKQRRRQRQGVRSAREQNKQIT